MAKSVSKKVTKELTEIKYHLLKDIFPNMDSEEIFHFILLLRSWCNDLLGEKD